jgi:hypothetical protein
VLGTVAMLVAAACGLVFDPFGPAVPPGWPLSSPLMVGAVAGFAAFVQACYEVLADQRPD